MTHMMQDILKLSIPERIQMVEAIWDSIEDKGEQLGVSSETIQLLDERLDAHVKNPSEGSTWNDVKARIQKQF
jgi:putative addiction module component (TIGR02574 family)